jgi:hypothetical protein
MVQFKTIFVILSGGQPMSDYTAQKALFDSLNVPNQPRKHWSLGDGWEIAEGLEMVVADRTKADLQNARFISLSCDEVTAVDNQSWLSVTAYTSMLGERVCHLLQVSRVVDGNGADNITNMLLTTLMHHGGLSPDQVGEKLIYFGVDGASIFQGSRNGMAVQLSRQFAPYMMSVHDVAHRTNHAVLSLNGLPMVKKLETLCNSLHVYFTKSPKQFLEFSKLAEVVETSGLKILGNVKTRWISLLEPMKRVLSEYKILIVKMNNDTGEESKVVQNLSSLCDVHTLLAFPYVIPLLESVDSLVKFAQSPNAFVSDYVAAVKICQAEIYEMYVDTTTSFQPTHFQQFHDIVTDFSHCITQKWVTDLNTRAESLAFRIGNHTYPAHQVIRMGQQAEKSSVSKEDFALAISSIKG